MKRGLFGMGILAVLLIVCLIVMGTAAVLPRRVVENLQTAADTALSGDWETTTALTEGARAEWEEIRLFYRCITYQDEIQKIDSLFSQLAAYQQAGEAGIYGATCLSLADQTRALGEDQLLTIWDFL